MMWYTSKISSASNGVIWHIVCIVYDVWHAALVHSNFSISYPLLDTLRGPLSLLSKLIQFRQLLFEGLYVITLISQFWLAFMDIILQGVLISLLRWQFDLSPSSLACRLEDMNTSALHCYIEEAKELRYECHMSIFQVLTADVDGVLECLSDLRIKFDHQVSLLCDIVVSHQYLLGDPLSELVPLQWVYHIDDPLSGQTSDISIVWQIVSNIIMFKTLWHDLFDGQPFVARNM